MIISLDFNGSSLQVKGEYIPEMQVLDPSKFREYVPTKAAFDIDAVFYAGRDITKFIESLEEALDPIPGNILFNAIEDRILGILKNSK
jgi:hypothetical protein